MQQKLFQSCCRLCLSDDSKQLTEIASVEKLVEALEQLYDLKISKTDRCSQQICGDCQQEVTEAKKWLTLQEELKKQITTNQERFETELLEQLGPEPIPEPPRVASPSPRSARLSRRSGRHTQTPTEEIPPAQPTRIKEEPVVVTRSSRRSGAKQEWEPPASDVEQSETPTSSSGSNGEGSNDDDEASTTESGTSSSSEVELKCPRCDATFTELAALEKHACRFTCSICSTVVKHKKSLKSHLINKHNVRADQWESYWNPPQAEADAGQDQSLLVEGRRPRKRYRYESDSPTDIEDGSDHGVPAPAVAITEPGDNIYCSLCNESFNGEHDCPFVCNICGNTFASPNNVKRHKVNVHKLDPDHPSLLLNNRRRSTSRPPSRAPSRPPSRAASECPSDDDVPLAEVAHASRSRCDSVASDWNTSGGGQRLYRFFCTDCDYANVRRYRVTAHMKSAHGIPPDQIDTDAIRKELLGMRSKTPEPPRTRHSSGSRFERARTPFEDVMALGGPAPALDPAPLDAMEAMMQDVPESASFPVLTTMASSPGFHRSRSKSTYMDDMDRKRKRSMSACSMREPRTNRAVSERNVLVAKRRLTNAELLSRVQSKFRPTMAGIQANRLQVTSQLSCVPVGTPMENPLRPRVSAHHPEEPCANKRLFRRRAPVGNERVCVTRLRRIFQGLCDRVPAAASANPIDVDALVLIPSEMLPPQPDPEPPIIVDEQPPAEAPPELPAQQPEPDSTTPVADDVPMDEDVRVVIEIAEEDNQSPEATPAAAEVIQTVETTEERSEEIVQIAEEQQPEGQQEGQGEIVEEEEEEVVEQVEEEEEVEETVRVEVQEVEDDGEVILPD